MKVLITGGAGFIGSTIASACADSGIEPLILDDLSTGLRSFAARFSFYEGDYGDRRLLRRVFNDHPDIDAVVHCAAKIVVPESTRMPLAYYANNVSNLIPFLEELMRSGCRRLVFSSTAAMYEPAPDLVVHEGSNIQPASPYAASKVMAERILADLAATTDLQVLALRYFNPIGADPELRTGLQVPNPPHALGMMFHARQMKRPFTITGTQWQTRDGSGLRDYIHVWDLALAHIAALARFVDVMLSADTAGRHYDVINLGTGRGTTVFELLGAFQRVVGEPIDVVPGPPRPGDVIGCYTSAEKARRLLGWTTQLTIEDAVTHSLAWHDKLPAVLAENR